MLSRQGESCGPLRNRKESLEPTFLVEVLKPSDSSKISWGLSSHDLLSLCTFFCNAVGFYTMFMHMWNCPLHLLLQITQRNLPEHCRLHPRSCGPMVVTMGTRKESFPNYFLYKPVLENSLGLCPPAFGLLGTLDSPLHSFVHTLFSPPIPSFSGATNHFPNLPTLRQSGSSSFSEHLVFIGILALVTWRQKESGKHPLPFILFIKIFL